MLGGTFDPVHIGHIRTATEAALRLGVSRLDLMPCHIPAHKELPGCASTHRLEMLQLAVANEPILGIDDREMLRNTPSYSVESCEGLRGEMKSLAPLYFVLGNDAFAQFTSWCRWHDMLALAHLVVVARAGESLEYSAEMLQLLQEREVTRVADTSVSPGGSILRMELTPQHVSATEVRRKLQAGESVRYLLPDDVIEYINEHGLYRNSAAQ